MFNTGADTFTYMLLWIWIFIGKYIVTVNIK